MQVWKEMKELQVGGQCAPRDPQEGCSGYILGVAEEAGGEPAIT